MKSMTIKKRELTPLTKKRVNAVNQVGRVMACLLTVLLLHSVAWADGTWDANKPAPGNPNPDNSCWIASAANMMAADGWGNAQSIYNYLAIPARLDPKFGGFQADAISYLNNNIGNSGFHNDPDEIITEIGRTYAGAVPGAKGTIDRLLATVTATELPGDQYGEGPDDPVGLGIYNDGNPKTGDPKLAHAITVWKDDANGLLVTDSDDAANGTVLLQWVNGSDTEINYYGKQAYVGYISFMSDVPEPSTIIAGALMLLPLGLGAVQQLRKKNA